MADTVVLLPEAFTVTVAGAEVTAQISEATFAFDTQTATVRTLRGETDLATGEKCTLTLAAYSDWQVDPDDSLCWVLWNNTGQRAQFVIVGLDPDSGVSITATGSFQARRPPFGTTADDASKFSLDMPVLGMPTLIPTPPITP